MIKFITFCMVLLHGLGPGFATQPRAQSLMDRPEPFSTILRTEGVLERPPPTAPGQLSPETKSSYTIGTFERYDGSRTATRTPPSAILNKIMTFITVRQPGKLSIVPEGLKVGSGLTWSLPVTSGLSAFATFNPSYRNISAPEAMWTTLTTGLQVPLVKGTPASGDLSLKFSTSIDHQFRPMFFFSLATPFTWINPEANPGHRQPSESSRGAF